MPNAVRPRGLIVRLSWIAAIALALFVAAMSRAPAVGTASGPDVLSSETVGPWQVIATLDTGTGPHCIARRELGGSGIDRPHTIEFLRGRGQETLRLTADGWTLPRDTVLPVTLAAGERVRGRSDGRLFTPTQLSIAAGDLLTTLERMASAPAIEVRVSGLAYTLPLSDITAMRAALARCIVERLGPEFGPLTVRLPVWPQDADLVEEHSFLTVRIGNEDYRLDTLVVRPAGARGRLPIALIGHGQDPRREMPILSMIHLQRQARDLAHRGYLAVAVIRRGFGQSDGIPGLSSDGVYGGCGTHAERVFDTAADDLAATLAVITQRPDADANHVILFGQSAAGPAVLALAARGLPGLRAVVLISGGLACWGGNDPPAYRWLVVRYLSSVSPRVLVVDRATGRPSYGAAEMGLPPARDHAMRLCRQDGGTETSCVPVMENLRLLTDDGPPVR